MFGTHQQKLVMTKRQKRLLKIRQNPKNVSLDALRQVLEDYGFRLDCVVGSHHIFRAELADKVWKLTIPFSRPILSFYVKQALKAVDEIIAIGWVEDEENDN